MYYLSFYHREKTNDILLRIKHNYDERIAKSDASLLDYNFRVLSINIGIAFSKSTPYQLELVDS